MVMNHYIAFFFYCYGVLKVLYNTSQFLNSGGIASDSGSQASAGLRILLALIQPKLDRLRIRLGKTIQSAKIIKCVLFRKYSKLKMVAGKC